MKKGITRAEIDKKESDPDLLPEYDFSNGVRGKYVQRLAAGSNIVVLAPDVEYTDNPDLPDREDIEIVADFLPRPKELVFKEIETEKRIVNKRNRSTAPKVAPVENK